MKVISTFHPPSSVVASSRCSLISGAQHLAVAKSDRIDVFSQQPSGLHHECTAPVWGRVVSVIAIHAKDTAVHDILVLTDHPEPSLFLFSPSVTAAGELSLSTDSKSISLHERIGRPAEFFTGLVVDQSERIVVASVYTGKLRVIDLTEGGLEGGFDVNIPELNILSLCFIPSDDRTPVLAILHRDYQQRVQLLSRDLSIDQFELSVQPGVLLQPTLLSSESFPQTDTPPILVPITATEDGSASSGDDVFPGGVLVVGGRKIILHKLAPVEWQERRKAKQNKETSRRKSSSAAELEKAREKEAARRNMKRKPFCSVEWPFGEITAWTQLDQDRLLVGDAFGKLAMIILRRSQSDMLLVIPLGEATPSTALSYLDNGFIFVGSHYGDSQIVRAHPSPRPGTASLLIPVSIATTSMETSNPKGKQRAENVNEEDEVSSNRGTVAKMTGSVIEVVQTFPGLSPIVDATIADVDGSGQQAVVVCSGGQGAGAIKVVRKGAELKEYATVDGFDNIVDVWSLKPHLENEQHTHVLVSTLTSTHCLELNSNTIMSLVESDAHQFVSDEPTIAAANMAHVTEGPSSIIAQVIRSGVRLVEYQALMGQFTLVDHWTSDRDTRVRSKHVVAASISSGRIALALERGTIVLLVLNKENKCMVEEGVGLSLNALGTDVPMEIAAISISPIDQTQQKSQYVIVSYWDTNEVAVFAHKRGYNFLKEVIRTGSLHSLPRSLLLYNFGSSQRPRKKDTRLTSGYLPYLLLGMADGSLTSYTFDDVQKIGKEDQYSIGDKKTVSLGTTPVSLTAMEPNDSSSAARAVCACGSHASFFFYNQGRLQQAPVLVNGVTAMTRVRFTDMPASMIVATSKTLSFGSFGPLDQTHIRSSNLGLETPTNIAWSPEQRVFGVACNRARPSRVGEYLGISNGSLKLMDGTSLDVVDHVNCVGELTTLSTVTLECEVGGKNENLTKFCAGTVLGKEADASCEGQVLLFNVHPKDSTSGKMLTVMSRMDVEGCVYAITSVSGLLAVAKDSSVTLLRLEHFGAADYHLIKLHEWNHNYVITSLSPLPSGRSLALGDALSSVSVLKIEEDTLKTVARNNTPLWPVAISALDDQTVVGVNADCNFFSFRVDGQGSVLEANGSWYLGDFINKLLPGAVAEAKGSPFLPRQLFFSSTGRIGLVSIIKDTVLSLLLTGLQRNMARVLPGTGNMNHTKYRTPANVRGRSDAQPEATGFLDGDFLEQYLSAVAPGSAEADAILAGANDAERIDMPDQQIRTLLEGLQSLH